MGRVDGKAKGSKAAAAALSADPSSATPPALARMHAHALVPALYTAPPPQAIDLYPSQPGFLLQLDGFLSEDECARLVAAADVAGLRPSSEADRHPKKGEAYLDRESVAFVDGSLTANLWARLRPILPDVARGAGVTAEPLGFHGDGRGRGGSGREGVSEQLKYYCYRRGQRFERHVDQSWKGRLPGQETEYTMLIYLNSAGPESAPAGAASCGQPLKGGSTIFYRTAREVLAEVRSIKLANTSISPTALQSVSYVHCVPGRTSGRAPAASCAWTACAPPASNLACALIGRVVSYSCSAACMAGCLMHEGAVVEGGAKYVLRGDIMYQTRVDDSPCP